MLFTLPGRYFPLSDLLRLPGEEIVLQILLFLDRLVGECSSREVKRARRVSYKAWSCHFLQAAGKCPRIAEDQIDLRADRLWFRRGSVAVEDDAGTSYSLRFQVVYFNTQHLYEILGSATERSMSYNSMLTPHTVQVLEPFKVEN